jgi:K+-transporting ATPase KdpF subunit
VRQQPINDSALQGEFVDAPLTFLGLGSVHAARCLDAQLAGGADDRKLRLYLRAEEAAMTVGYIASGVVALVVTIYLFVALLFPERF